jgi:hypothetical protein
VSASTSARRDVGTESRLGDLLTLSVAGLEPMFVSSRGVFCHRLVDTPAGLVPEGLSPRYTTMTLLGLHRYEATGRRSPFAVRELTTELLRNTDWLENAGDLGLLLWTCAEITPELLDECIVRTDATAALERSADAARGSTMELAWFLTGVAKRVLAEPAQRHRWERIARSCYSLVKRNQGASGFFGHLAARTGPRGWLRGRIGSFADQVYPIIALTHFAEAFHEETALAAARACARAICDAQGSLGQWWWHYDAPSGRVVQRYPVYSVHQDGMAPMALLALGRATGQDFVEPVAKGLEWIYGRNELGVDMRDLQNHLIWRAIRFSSRSRLVGQELRWWLQSRVDDETPRGLTVWRECRPYHLGWLLYAFAPQNGGTAA